MSGWNGIRQKYDTVREKIDQRSARSVAFYLLSFVLSAGLGGWAIYLYDVLKHHRTGRCSENILTALIGLGIVSLLSSIAALCICFHVRSAFKSFVERTGEIVSRQDPDAPPDDSQPLIREKEGKSEDNETKALHWIDTLRHEKVVAGTITDSIAMACCSTCYLICAWVVVLVFLVYGVILSWSLNFNDHALCWVGSQHEMVNLQLQLRIYFIVWLGSFACQIVCFLHFTHDAVTLLEIHRSQHQIMKHLDLKPSVFILPPNHNIFISSSSSPSSPSSSFSSSSSGSSSLTSSSQTDLYHRNT